MLSLRCDVNISIREKGTTKLGTKVEIKNLNSFQNIKKAIDFEITRQTALIECGIPVVQETRRFDEFSKETVLMRIKTDVVDYKCFTEPNILPIKLSKEFIDNAIKTSPELAEVKLQRYKSLGLNDYDSGLLVANKDVSDYFDEVIFNGANAKLAANWILVDVQSILNKKNISITQFGITPIHLAHLISLIEKGVISNQQGRAIFAKMLEVDVEPEQLISTSKTTKLSEEELLGIIKKVLNDNPQSIIDYNKGKDRAVGYLVAKVIKETEGSVNPSLINALIIKELKVR